MNKILFPLLAGVWLCACCPKNQEIAIVPYPNHIEPGKGTFAVAGQAVEYDLSADSLTVKAVRDFAGKLGQATGVESPVAALGKTSDAGIRFLVDTKIAKEGYKIDVTTDGVTVWASSFPGFFYGIQSLKQMLPVAIYGTEPAPAEAWTLPCVAIDDAPRFGYRGMHLDVSRHFFPIEEVKRYIDAMALHKLNVLHWHLTDDQGWRIEIKAYPELTTVGSIRNKTVIRKDWGNYDTTPYGGYFTQDEIREVVKYAGDRAIEVIPEVDLPGHMLAALTAYPKLGCTGGPYEVWGRWGVADDVLCAGNEATFTFLEGVLAEVVELFPSKYIHIGGDECPKVRWEKCPRCQARIKQLGLKSDSLHSAEHYLQSYVMARVGDYLKARDRRIIGWDEILEGHADPDATIMSWRGSEGGIAAAKLGHDVIMTPNSHFYFDYYQSLDTENEPFGIGGYVPIEHVYSYDPAFGDKLTPEQQAHIIGVQANLWTEYIHTGDHLEYMLLPRLAALSEVQWCNPGVRNWERFVKDFKMDKIYSKLGYNYGKHLFGITGSFAVNPEKQCVEMTLITQGDAPVYYSFDGQEGAPTRYTGPVEIGNSCKFRASVQREGMEVPDYTKEFRFSKSTGRRAVLNSAPTAKFTYGGPSLLVDGYHGGLGYTNGAWMGFLEEPFDVTIDMQGAEPYSSVNLESYIERGEWVFPPSAVRVYTSDNGTDFAEAAVLTMPAEREDDRDGVRNYRAEFPQTGARYLRVVAEPVASMPAWHGAAGHKAHMFVGEIDVM